jgi:hypothetical protein
LKKIATFPLRALYDGKVLYEECLEMPVAESVDKKMNKKDG